MVAECEIPSSQLLSEKPDKSLARPGVYAILCDESGKYYVGSSKDIRGRFLQHVRCLKGGYHANGLLQANFDRVGPSRTVFKALEFCENNQLHERENYWIEATQCHHTQSGLNLNRDSSGNTGIPHTESTKKKISMLHLERFKNDDTGWTSEYTLISASGKVVSGKNIADFCRRNGMGRKDESPISHVVAGKKTSHKGWTSLGGKKRVGFASKSFRLISPNGDIVSGKNLEKFCRDNGLSMWGMGNVVRGTQAQSNGWRLPSDEPVRAKFSPKERVLLSPDGKEFRFTSATEFSRNNNLCLVSVYKIFTGVLKHHKGWRKPQC